MTPGVDFGFTLLGTGSPRPNLARSQPAAVVHCGDETFLVDCGDGTTTQLLRAGIDPATVTKVFLTHLHWDHILGYPSLVWGGWSLGRRDLDVWGPPGSAMMHRALVADFYADQADFAEKLGYPAGGWAAIRVNEIAPATIRPLDGLLVRAAHVHHPPMESFGYRFEYQDKAIVLSGDTAYCPELVDLARGADVLVVDACAYSSDESAAGLVTRLHTFHASPYDAALMAQQAGVGHLVLTHLLPDVDAAAVVDVCRSAYGGRISVGEDLTRYPV